jgi:two-component system, sensor histidine kinase RegB
VIPTDEESLGRQARRLRLNTLIGLRWLAVVGQSAAILVGAFAFGLKFPILGCFGLVAASAALNLVLRWRFPVSMQLSERAAAIMLAYDILQLAGLLLLTGGVANPFAVLLLAPVTIAATSLPLREALGLLGLALASATALLAVSLPMPWLGGESLILPPMYVLARWVALAVSAAFVTLYAYRVAAEARQTASALTAVELVLARAQHLSQIDGLAAAAAHELGTPLATVALVVREMAAEPHADEAFKEDLQLLEQSVERCRSILAKLSAPGELSSQQMDISSPVEMAEIAASPYRLRGVDISVEGEGADPPPKCPRSPGCLYGLGNLIENAVSFAEKAVVIRASWTKSTVRITISDDGRGFPPNVLTRIGEPYLSQRDGDRRKQEAGGGLGLGLFIARSLLERSGAALQFGNAVPPAKGAVVTISWQRAAYGGRVDGRNDRL